MIGLHHSLWRWKHYALYFLLMWLMLVLFYWPVRHAGFEGDFTGWLYSFQHESFADIFHRRSNRVKSLYQLTMSLLWVFTAMWGKSSVGWLLLQTGLHALNASLLMLFIQRLLVHFQQPYPVMQAVAASFLFTLCWTQVEVIIWKGAFHYLTGLCLMLSTLLAAQQYLHAPKKHWLYFCWIIFSFSCFSLEIFYITPWLVLLLIMSYKLGGAGNGVAWVNICKSLFLPLLIIFCAYWLLYFLSFDKLIAHYNWKDHSFDFTYWVPKFRLYPSQVLWWEGTFWFPEQWSYQLWYKLASYLLVSVAVLCVIRLIWKKSALGWVLSFWLAASIAALIIVAPLGFSMDHRIRNGHYAYIYTAFIWPFVVMLLFRLVKHKPLRVILFMGIMIVHVISSCHDINIYQQSHLISKQFFKSYPLIDKGKHQIILAMPATYKGLVVLGADSTERFTQVAETLFDTSFGGRKYTVSAYNMESVQDKISVVRVDSGKFQVCLMDKNRLWLYRYFEPFNYSTDIFHIHFSSDLTCYTLSLKVPEEKVEMVYYSEGKWKHIQP